MFGTVLADRSHLTEAQTQRYHSVYCGLCRCIGENYGFIAKMALSYDMVFLILLLNSLYEPEETCSKKACPVHPTKPRSYTVSPFSDYAAAMNVALAYYKALDDWQDERKLSGWILSKLLSRPMGKIEADYPEKCAVMKRTLSDLSALEQANVRDPDKTAVCFGHLTEELFSVRKNDYWDNTLRKLGDALGRFIYLSDALTDLREDLRKNRFNPLKDSVTPETEDDFLPVLHLLLGDCTAELERLPLVQDADILRNILYSGVWIPYNTHRKKRSDTLV